MIKFLLSIFTNGEIYRIHHKNSRIGNVISFPMIVFVCIYFRGEESYLNIFVAAFLFFFLAILGPIRMSSMFVETTRCDSSLSLLQRFSSNHPLSIIISRIIGMNLYNWMLLIFCFVCVLVFQSYTLSQILNDVLVCFVLSLFSCTASSLISYVFFNILGRKMTFISIIPGIVTGTIIFRSLIKPLNNVLLFDKLFVPLYGILSLLLIVTLSEVLAREIGLKPCPVPLVLTFIFYIFMLFVSEKDDIISILHYATTCFYIALFYNKVTMDRFYILKRLLLKKDIMNFILFMPAWVFILCILFSYFALLCFLFIFSPDIIFLLHITFTFLIMLFLLRDVLIFCFVLFFHRNRNTFKIIFIILLNIYLVIPAVFLFLSYLIDSDSTLHLEIFLPFVHDVTRYEGNPEEFIPLLLFDSLLPISCIFIILILALGTAYLRKSRMNSTYNDE